MKKQIALAAVCAALAICVFTAGCTSPTASSPSASPSPATSTAQVLTPSASRTSPSVTPTPSVTLTPTPASSSLPSGGSASGLTLLFFYRPTCPKCQATEPIINQLQTNYGGKLTVQRINDDENADLASQNRVSIVPTVILMKNGVEVQRWVYPIDYAAVAGQINNA